MIVDRDTEAPPATPADDRRRARQADLDAANEHGERLLERYGRTDMRPRFAAVGHANAKRFLRTTIR
jgi:hypothetical protein